MSSRVRNQTRPSPGKGGRSPRKGAFKNREEEGNGSSEDEVMDDEEGGLHLGGVYVPPPPKPYCSSECIGPRLLISHIVNENFKSYAGKQILGPFHKSFTSIIGPNGSGKSNVIDSMLFVFGYRATKIRSKKISVLIHKSEKHQNVKSCTVAVHFSLIRDMEGERFEILQGSKFVVSRTAFTDSSSFYTINGSRAQFKDVASVLRSHGIDLVHNRFLILQGEVETIAMMKPKAQNEHDTGMLEYLEDIIGTSRFKRPIEKLNEKVLELSEERQEKLTRLKNAEKEKESLKAPMLNAVEFLKWENKKACYRNAEIQRKIYDCEIGLKETEEEKRIFDQNMAEIKEKLKNILEERNSKEKEMNSKKKKLGAMKAEKDKLTEAFRTVEHKAIQNKERVTQTNKQRKKAAESKKNEEEKLEELEKVPEKNTKEIEELTVVQEKLKKEIKKEEEEVEKVLESLKAETQELQEKKDVLSDKLLLLNNKRDSAKSKHELAKSELQIYMSNQEKETAKCEQMKMTLQNTGRRVTELRQNIARLESEVPKAKEEAHSTEAELREVINKETNLREELGRTSAALEDVRSSLQASSSHNRVLDFIMKQKQSGEIPGIYGRLGDLGGISEKYDVAMSTSCGLLDHIVVDTVDTGKMCLEALKRYNVGRANFVAVDKQQKLRDMYSRPFRAPENVPRLFDLVQIEDERVRPAFYFALRDTLVANDLAQGKRVAYGATRYRVVTLTGEIIEVSGTMSGGGNTVTKGRMGRSAKIRRSSVGNAQDIAQMERKVEQLRGEASSLGQSRSALEHKLSSLKTNLKVWTKDLDRFKVELQGAEKQISSTEVQLKEQEAVVLATRTDPKELAIKQKSVESLNSEYEKASQASAEIETKVNEFSAQIEAATGGRMKEAQKKLDSAKKKHDKVQAEITKLRVAITSSVRNVKKAKEKITSLNNEIKEAEEALKMYGSERQKIDRDGIDINKDLEKISDEIMKFEESTVELREILTELMQGEGKIKAFKLNEEKKTDNILQQIQGFKAGVTQFKKDLRHLKLHEIFDADGKPMVVGELETLSEGELLEINPIEIGYKIVHCDEELNKMKPNLQAISDFKEKVELCNQRNKELDEITTHRNEARKAHDEVRKARMNEFMTGFAIISSKLKEMYQMITLGGDAEFELVDTLDPFSEGVIFSVRPPKKSWKNISNLSGGEKTLSSLALVFALHYYRPSPFYVMDEIDAALDFKNVSIVGHYIKERTRNAQFIIISLRHNMFELADLLVGIYKTDNCTKCIAITPGEYSKRRNPDEIDENEVPAKQMRIS